MLVFLTTVLVVAALLILDRVYPKVTNPVKYTNLDWEVICDADYYTDRYKGHIFSVVGNNVRYIYESRSFSTRREAEEFIKKICRTMKMEYGIANSESSLMERAKRESSIY